MNYWRECVSVSAEECGLAMTQEQLDYMADAVEGAFDTYGLYTGRDVADRNLSDSKESEIKKLKDALKEEKEKVQCPVCHGRGNTVTYGGTMMATSQCYKCGGEGKVKP